MGAFGASKGGRNDASWRQFVSQTSKHHSIDKPRQTDRQKDTQTDRKTHTDTQTDKTDRQTDRRFLAIKSDRNIIDSRQTDIQTDQQTDRDRQTETDIHTDRNRNIYRCMLCICVGVGA